MVTVEGLGKIGYVANSPCTVIGESMSAGRVYDKIGDTLIPNCLEALVKKGFDPRKEV